MFLSKRFKLYSMRRQEGLCCKYAEKTAELQPQYNKAPVSETVHQSTWTYLEEEGKHREDWVNISGIGFLPGHCYWLNHKSVSHLQQYFFFQQTIDGVDNAVVLYSHVQHTYQGSTKHQQQYPAENWTINIVDSYVNSVLLWESNKSHKAREQHKPSINHKT